MHLTTTIFRQEWRLFRRQRWMPFSLLLFIVIACVSIYSGRNEVKARLVQTDTIRANYERDVDTLLRKFVDTATAKGKADAKNAGLAVMVNFRLPQPTIKEPSALAALCTGLMDVKPWFAQIRYVKNFSEEAVVPLSNPLVLFAGNFDYAFVLIYLLPLLIISWCYAVYDAEKNAGTLRLLTIQSGKPRTVIRTKLFFRFVILATVLTGLNTGGIIASSFIQPVDWATGGWWCILSLLYLSCWFACCRMVIAWRSTGTVTALSLVACWLLLLLVAPSLANAYTQARHPLPLKDEIAAYRRHQSEIIWNSSAKTLSDSFNFYNPQYRSTIDEAKDTVKLSDRYVAGYYELLEERMKRVMHPYDSALKARNNKTQSLLNWDPALLTQSAMASLAANDGRSYDDYTAQADSFQQQWQDFLYPYHFSGKKLDAAAIAGKLPRFYYRQPGLSLPVVMQTAVVLGVIILLLLSAAWYTENKHEYN